MFEASNQWISGEHGSQSLYRFWTPRGSGRTRRESLGTTDLEVAKERFTERIGPDARQEPRTWCVAGVIYFVRAESTGFIKIGWTSTDPMGRIAALQTGSGPLTLLAQTVGDRKLERAFHKLFEAHRKHGEWFMPTPDLIRLIDALSC